MSDIVKKLIALRDAHVDRMERGGAEEEDVDAVVKVYDDIIRSVSQLEKEKRDV